jgi:hypothetical protein
MTTTRHLLESCTQPSEGEGDVSRKDGRFIPLYLTRATSDIPPLL